MILHTAETFEKGLVSFCEDFWFMNEYTCKLDDSKLAPHLIRAKSEMLSLVGGVMRETLQVQESILPPKKV